MSTPFKVLFLLLILVAGITFYQIFSEKSEGEDVDSPLVTKKVEKVQNLTPSTVVRREVEPKITESEISKEPIQTGTESVVEDESIAEQPELPEELKSELLMQAWSDEKINAMRDAVAAAEQEFFADENTYPSPERMAKLAEMEAQGNAAEEKFLLNQQGENLNYSHDRSREIERLNKIGNEVEKDLVIDDE